MKLFCLGQIYVFQEAGVTAHLWKIFGCSFQFFESEFVKLIWKLIWILPFIKCCENAELLYYIFRVTCLTQLTQLPRVFPVK